MIGKDIPTLAVINGKGGCGKTTIVTNLAAYYSSQKVPTTIVDYDPQGSSRRWVQARPAHFDPIFVVDLHALQNKHFTRSWQFQVPSNTGCIILDTPAGVSGDMLDDVIRRSRVLIIPVLPSAHDIRATAHFITELLLNASFRRYHPALCIVANRVEPATLVFNKLQRFLNSLNIPFVSTFTDNRYYLQAAEKGVGICEIVTRLNESELKQWRKLAGWCQERVGERPSASESYSRTSVIRSIESSAVAASQGFPAHVEKDPNKPLSASPFPGSGARSSQAGSTPLSSGSRPSQPWGRAASAPPTRKVGFLEEGGHLRKPSEEATSQDISQDISQTTGQVPSQTPSQGAQSRALGLNPHSPNKPIKRGLLGRFYGTGVANPASKTKH